MKIRSKPTRRLLTKGEKKVLLLFAYCSAFLLLLRAGSEFFSIFDERALSIDLLVKHFMKPGIGKPKIVGFWHIGHSFQSDKNESRDEFAMKQGREILSTYLFSKEGLDSGAYDLRLNYVTTLDLSQETKEFFNQSGLIHELKPTVLEMEADEEYYEFPTLTELHSFCLAPENEETIVFYIHSKTSDAHRLYRQNYLLGKSCQTCMKNEKKMACGPRYTGSHGWFWSHFSGNFWMTRCSHISKLNRPFHKSLLYEFQNGMTSKEQSNAYPPYGRIFAEYWMMNDAGKRPTRSTEYETPALISYDKLCTDKSFFVDGDVSRSLLDIV